MIMKEYPSYTATSLPDVVEILRQIINIRKDDIIQGNNLNNSFIAGRKVGRVPSASIDVIDGDKIGDFNYDINYIYVLVDNAGTGVWRRAALSAW